MNRLIKKILIISLLLFNITCSHKNNNKNNITYNYDHLLTNQKESNYQTYLNQYYSLINNYENNLNKIIEKMKNEKYDKYKIKRNEHINIYTENKLIDHKLINDYQELLNKMEQIIKQNNNHEIINNYQHLKQKIKNKQQWLINKYRQNIYQTIIFCFNIIFTCVLFFCFVIIKFYFIDFCRNKRNCNINLDFSKQYSRFFLLYLPFIVFPLLFLLNCTNYSWHYLANFIHYQFTKNKYSWYNTHYLPKKQAQYFYCCDHYMIVNNEKYFKITFIDQNFILVSYANFIIKTLSLFTIIWALVLIFRNDIDNFILVMSLRIFIWWLFLTEIITFVDIIVNHVFGNNIVHQFFSMAKNKIKMLPLINKFCYLSKKKDNYFQKHFSSLINYLFIIGFFLMVIFLSLIIDLVICKKRNIKTYKSLLAYKRSLFHKDDPKPEIKEF